MFKISESQIFECEINQNDVKKMNEKVIKSKIQEYNPPLFLRTNKGKKYYPYIISIPSTDFTNAQKRIFSFFYKYKLENLIGFHPFTKDKSPPSFKDIDKDKKNCLAKFYQLFKNDIKYEIFDSYFNKYFLANSNLDDFPFILLVLESKLKNGITAPVLEKIIFIFNSFSWNEKYDWEKYFPEAKEHFYNDFIKPLFLGNTDNFKQLYLNIEEISKNVINKLFITYDFEVNHFKYYNDEKLLSSCLTTLGKKQLFYGLYYELLLDNGYYRGDFKYKKYLNKYFAEIVIDKYLKYENKTISWKKFDFAGEDKYGTYEGGGGCYRYKGYHVSSYSFRKTNQGKFLYLDHEVFNSLNYSTYYKTEKHFYLNENIINLSLYGIQSTFSFDDNNIIVTDGGDKPYIYNIKEDKINNDIIFDNFNEKCYEAIILENKLIVVSGHNMIGYYYQSDKEHYKIIHTYKPEFEGEKKILI